MRQIEELSASAGYYALTGYREIGQHLPAGHPDRHAHLARACDLLNGLHASFDLIRAQELLSAAG